MIETNILLLYSIIVTISLIIFMQRKTILSIYTTNNSINWWSLLLYKQLIFVLSAPLCFTFIGLEKFPFFENRINDEYVFKMNWIVLYSIIVFYFALSVSLILFGLVKNKNHFNLDSLALYKSRIFTISVIVVAFSLMFIGLFLFTHKHALLLSIFENYNIREIRGYNSFYSNFPGIFASILGICAWIPAIHSGYELKNKNLLFSLLFLICALILSGIRGDKAPIITCFTLLSLSYLMASNKTISSKLFSSSLIGISFMSILIYYVVKLQYPEQDLNSFFQYIIERLGVGQMGGVYLGINYMDKNINNLPTDFWLNIFPLSSQFIEHQEVAKYIMLELTGKEYNETGIMNSLFISEAYGIGGWVLLFLSPIIVGFSFALALKIIKIFFNKLFSNKISSLYYIPFGLESLNITGGFSQFPLQKVLFINLFIFIFVWIVYIIINNLMKIK